MKNKILIFVYNEKKDKFLLIFDKKHINNASDKKGITISQVINEKEYNIARIIADIKHQIGLNPNDVISLNWGSVYKLKGEEFKEMNYFAYVNSDKITLKRKDLKYKWLDINTFIKQISWNDNKELLRRVLIKATNKEIYFDKKERGE